ncbi:PREDICTED: signal transducing adapter molecule 1-like [Amphimedon queenslandica]|uniref:Signal transducing adapter molecule 1 n=1 Tax=Amphimedon queenslandica TaxID=400682 RepID=A0A1X7V768_AMPQE|nr:PREDICTED: signal transducing adapter molecule 1-like [Amphimedon queenslandica]|eukprot:XP_019850252.1 PREDICTED: signal transducing adapter molecule 1-like [Amphimedon queenslandica]
MSYDSDVAAATTGRDTDWDKIIKLCDRIRESFGSAAMGSALGSVMRRIKHSDPNIQWQAINLLEACVSNCGKDFELELSKPSFHSQVKDILTSRTVDQRSVHRLKTLLATWAADYKGNSQMSGFNSFIEQLIRDGLIVLQGNQPTSSTAGFGAPSMYSSVSPPQRTREDDDLQKAIRLSLEEAQSKSSPSMYPTFSDSPPTHHPLPASSSANLTSFNVRAIYDFEAVEDNELSFKAGEVINVIDNSDENWWKGKTQLGTGLFPANFVSPDLSASPEPVRGEQKATGNNNNNTNNGGVTEGAGSGRGAKAKVTEVNETQVDLLLDMLKNADISSENPEELKTLNELEAECKSMKPIAESNIEGYDKQLMDMNEVSEKLQQALSTYRRLLQEKPRLLHKATPPEAQPPPYQYNTGETEDYYAPPPPDVTGTYHGSFNVGGGGYNPPYGTGYHPPTQTGAYAPPTNDVAPPSFSSYLPSLQHQGPPPSHQAPPTNYQFNGYDQQQLQGGGGAYAPPTHEVPPHHLSPNMRSHPPNRSPPMFHHQMVGGGGAPTAAPNTLWMNSPQAQPLL